VRGQKAKTLSLCLSRETSIHQGGELEYATNTLAPSVSLNHCVTVSLCHCVTMHYVTMSLPHYVTMSLCHCVTVSLTRDEHPPGRRVGVGHKHVRPSVARPEQNPPLVQRPATSCMPTGGFALKPRHRSEAGTHQFY